MTAGANGWREDWTLDQGEVQQWIFHSKHNGMQLSASTTTLPVDHRPHFPSEIIAGAF